MREFLALAAAARIRPTVQAFPLAEANTALQQLRSGAVRGAKVLRIGGADGRRRWKDALMVNPAGAIQRVAFFCLKSWIRLRHPAVTSITPEQLQRILAGEERDDWLIHRRPQPG